MRPRLLDLFCGAGGAARGYQRAGFYVVGVDNRPQPRYAGDEFVQEDALDVLRALLSGETWHGYVLADFAVIHASPPCQPHSSLTGWGQSRAVVAPKLDLIPQTRALLIIVVRGSIGRTVFDPRRKAIAPSLELAREVMDMPGASASELADAIPPAYTEHVGGYLMADLRARAAA